ncbi:MAG: UDP-N-acetylmuramoyl-tripeptide--D-alanyl-D-alanine ligase [Patescibacteria group bacterium]|nr:UDP-N-acetylmuramoyl-tripeptide--D-alanyl-D-alanine ligase [Patescibacteria group bacterium]
MKKIFYFKLKIFARLIIAKYRPKVVGITGSVGKTSSKEAVFSVLKQKFEVRTGVKNFNNELGTPLTIIGCSDSPGRNIFKWMAIFCRALGLLLGKKKYPEILILEMGADKPGDIEYLTSIARPEIALITAIGPSHLEFFGNIKNIVKEKSKILAHLGLEGIAILNNDDEHLVGLIKNSQYQVITFGRQAGSQVRVEDIKISKKGKYFGTAFKLSHRGSIIPIFLPGVLGWQHAQAAAAAAAVGLALGMNLVEISKGLLDYKPARGRTNLIGGIKNTLIIDDTYNASPQSAKAALDLLVQMPALASRIAVFGDMLELGAISEEAHQEVGRYLVKLGIEYLFVVGERSRDIASGAKAAGMSEDKIYHFPYNSEAGIFLQERIKEGDLILVKGSRGAKMEEIVCEIMAKPWQADKLLVAPVKK